MRKWIFYLTTILTMAGAIFQFRYKLLNILSGTPFLRKSFVRVSMNIPFIRRSLLSHMFRKA